MNHNRSLRSRGNWPDAVRHKFGIRPELAAAWNAATRQITDSWSDVRNREVKIKAIRASFKRVKAKAKANGEGCE